jgi:hypothetical protein
VIEYVGLVRYFGDMNCRRRHKHRLWATDLSAAFNETVSLLFLHDPKLVEGDSWLGALIRGVCEGELLEGADLRICRCPGGVPRSFERLQRREASFRAAPEAAEPNVRKSRSNFTINTTMAALVNYGSSDEEDNLQEDAPQVDVSPILLRFSEQV